MKNHTYLLLLSLAIIACSCGNSSEKKKNKITVFVAASLSDVATALKDSFELKHDIRVVLNKASSGTLARQIGQGATADVFVSANKKWAAYVDSIGAVKVVQKEIAHNQLVLVAPLVSEITAVNIDSTLDLITLLGDGRLSIGDPKHVPVGKYAQQVLNHYVFFDRSV